MEPRFPILLRVLIPRVAGKEVLPWEWQKFTFKHWPCFISITWLTWHPRRKSPLACLSENRHKSISPRWSRYNGGKKKKNQAPSTDQILQWWPQSFLGQSSHLQPCSPHISAGAGASQPDTSRLEAQVRKRDPSFPQKGGRRKKKKGCGRGRREPQGTIPKPPWSTPFS